MVGLASAENHAARIKDAIKDSNWEALERGLDRLKQIFFDSVVFGDRQVATFIGKAIADTRNELLLAARLRPERTAESMSWVLASDSATCMAGLRMFRPESNSYASTAENVEQQVLKQLYESGGPLSTGELAKKIKCAPETASRALTGLRDRAFVRTVPVGRARLHYITRRGQLHLIGVHGSQAPAPTLTKASIPKEIIQTIDLDMLAPAQFAPPPPQWVLNEHAPGEVETGNADPCTDCLAHDTLEKVAAYAVPEASVVRPILEMTA